MSDWLELDIGAAVAGPIASAPTAIAAERNKPRIIEGLLCVSSIPGEHISLDSSRELRLNAFVPLRSDRRNVERTAKAKAPVRVQRTRAFAKSR
jgi:hypothetical protein